MDLSSARNFQKIGYIFVIIGAVADVIFIPETFGFSIILCIISMNSGLCHLWRRSGFGLQVLPGGGLGMNSRAPEFG